MKKNSQKEKSIIESLHTRQEAAFTDAYYVYRSYFIKWARKQFPSIEHVQIEDIYQNALIVFIEKFIWTNRIRIENDEIVGLTTSISSFIISIGRNMILNEIKKGKQLPISQLEKKHQQINFEESHQEEKELKNELVEQAFSMLKEKEKDVIYFKYVLGYSYEEIRKVMNLESADSLKTLCARYMKRFRTNFKQLREEENNYEQKSPKTKTDSDRRGIPSDSID